MNKLQAFESCLSANKNNMPKSIWAGYKHRLKMGTLKDATITTVLTNFGWTKISDEQWENDSITEKREESPAFEFMRLNSVSKKYELKRVKAPTLFQAIIKSGKKWQYVKSKQSVINFINKSMNENFGAKRAIGVINSDIESNG